MSLNVVRSTDGSGTSFIYCGAFKVGKMAELPNAKESIRSLYEKCKYLRARSLSLRREGRDLCKTSHSLRGTNAMLAGDMRVIRATGFLIPKTKHHDSDNESRQAPGIPRQS
jgi:hypothetical protein